MLIHFRKLDTDHVEEDPSRIEVCSAGRAMFVVNKEAQNCG
jgi:hypothetical protein